MSQLRPSSWYSLSALPFLYSLEPSSFFQSAAGGRSWTQSIIVSHRLVSTRMSSKRLQRATHSVKTWFSELLQRGKRCPPNKDTFTTSTQPCEAMWSFGLSLCRPCRSVCTFVFHHWRIFSPSNQNVRSYVNVSIRLYMDVCKIGPLPFNGPNGQCWSGFTSKTRPLPV